MKTLVILLLGLTFYCTNGKCSEEDGVSNYADTRTNLTNPDKDMYVIHATVYQIGILTNKTDNYTDHFNSTGQQESVTLYHTNGTNVDLSKIPEPFLTNVTAQTLVGVAPIPQDENDGDVNAWSTLEQLRHPAASSLEVFPTTGVTEDQSSSKPQKRSLDYENFILRLFKRDTSGSTSMQVERGSNSVQGGHGLTPVQVENGSNPVRVEHGSALIPAEAGVQSISLPPLLSLNNNMTEIPVPIPNTSVVHYAKVNTLVQKP